MNELKPIELRRIEFEKKMNLPDSDEFLCERTNKITSLETCESSCEGLKTIHENNEGRIGCKFIKSCEKYKQNKK